MVILKKIVIMTEHGKSNCSGIVKFENFAGRTSCFVRILGMKGSGVICIKCGDDIMYLGNLFDGEHKFNALYDLNKTIQIVVVADGSVVSMGSNKGRFSPNALMIDIHRYYARMPQRIDDTTEAVEIVEQIASQQNHAEESCRADAQENSIEDAVAEVGQEPAVLSNAEETTFVREDKVEKITRNKQDKKVSQTKTAEPFYKKIEKNLNELFEVHEKDEELTLLIPDSKWARVPIEGDGYYVVGVIESDGVPNIICYGVPDKDDSNPPQNSNDCRQWMEIEKGGRGYWMMYQSAVSGETLTTTII
ncbi:MAG: hypothetical protein K2L52_05725 [Clostridia bacterium]|nr:hypothetical protein [Clostridia bacterium]